MPDNGKLIIKIDGNATDFEKEIRKAIETAKKQTTQYNDQYKKSLKANADLLKGVNTAAATVMGLTATAGAAVLSYGVKYNAQMEQYKASFTTMLGDADKAEAKLSELRNMAEKTPFELTDLAQASTTLLAFGEDVESLMPDLKMLGDISLGNQEKFKGLALVFGQVKSQGKLMGQDLLQMINQGFNPLQIISQKTGESMSSLKDKMSKGQISFEMVADAMKTATSAGGQFYKAMENQSKTLNGQWSTLKDNIASLTGEISSGISKTLTEDVLPKAIAKTEELKAAWKDGTLQKHLGTATAVATTFGVALLGWNAAVIIGDLNLIIKGVQSYTAVTKAGAAAQNLLNASMLANPYALAATTLAALVAGIVVYGATHKTATKQIEDSLKELKSSHEDAIIAIEKKTSVEIAEAEKVRFLKEELYDLEKQINNGKLSDEEATGVKEEFANIAAQLEDIIPGITDALYDENGAINIQVGKVNELTDAYYDLMVAKSMANAYQEKFDQTNRDIVAAKDKEKEAQTNYEFMKKASEESSFYGGLEPKSFDLNRWLIKGSNQKDLEDAKQLYDDAVNFREKLEQNRENDYAEWQSELKKATKLQDKYFKNIESGTKTSGKHVSSVNNSNTASTKKATNEQKKILKERYDYEVELLNRAHDLCEISDDEYYKALAATRNEYLDESDEEWHDATYRIQKYYADMLENAKQKTIDSIDELKKAKEAIADNLKPQNTSYTKTSMSFRTSGNGDKEQWENYNKYELADFASENAKLDEYNNMLREMYNTKGSIPQQIIEDLRNMNVQEGMEYVKTILSTSDEEWNKQISDMLANEQKRAETSDLLVLDEMSQLKKDFEDEFGELPEGFFDIGEDSAEMFGKGLMEKLHIILVNAKAEIESVLSSVGNGAYTVVASGGGGNTYYDNRSTTMNISASSPRGFYEEVKSFNTYEKHTSKWG